ncbi:peptidylprolyl isomerase [Paenibacillus protaetiae]|uniref:Peptidylprolyl isomerase n=1 Tax=Paenibacillus protaetiae TaxID=2509456 RepID=A0A4P6F2X8_9BACL|nr:peptidylprolyl isomerase [Paenibacillus protaetiae]QAY67457.1 peptidylprolyl isomerase [Paenibacillus protaetiae]
MLHGLHKLAWRRSALLVMAAVLVVTVLSACGKKEGDSFAFAGQGKGTVVATYDGGNVTEQELDKYLGVFNIMQPGYEQLIEIPQFKEQLLKQYIAYKVLSGQASEETKKKALKDSDEQFKDFKDYAESDANMKATMESKKITNDDVKTYLNLMLVVVDHMNSQVTEDQMKAEYEKNKSSYNPVTLRHILIGTTQTDQTTGETKDLRTSDEALARAKEVKAKLDAGGDWNALAKEYSDDPGSKDNGGLYENADVTQFVEEFKDAALKQEVGKIGDPVETEYGYHIIKVEKRDVLDYKDITQETKDKVKSAIAYNNMSQYMTNDLEKLNVKVTLPEPSPSPSASAGASASPSASPDAAASPSASADAQASETPKS